MLTWIINFILDYLRRQRKPSPPSAPPTPPDFASRIVAAMRKYGFRVDEGPDVYNIVYVKNVDQYGDPRPDRGRYHYDDQRVVLQVIDGHAEIVESWDATVDPFISVNPGGAAQIACPSQQTAWQTGWHKGTQWGLLQTGGVAEINRDSNGNFVRDSGDTPMKGWYGINHHAGMSAGCLTVPNLTDHKDFMRIIQRDHRYRDNPNFIFTTTILPRV
jgi:hypothetical protein